MMFIILNSVELPVTEVCFFVIVSKECVGLTLGLIYWQVTNLREAVMDLSSHSKDSDEKLEVAKLPIPKWTTVLLINN